MNGLALLAFLVAAQEPQEVAQKHYRKALVHYDSREFDRAINEFEQAYAITGAPELLFNLGQAHRLRGDWQQALHCYRSYLERVPDASNRDDVQARIGEMQQKVAATRVVRERPVWVAQKDKEAHPGTTLKVAGIVTGASGLALIGAGVYYGLSARSSADQITQLSKSKGQWSPDEQAAYQSGQNAASRATLFYVVGGAAVAGGGVLYWLGTSEARVAPTPLPGGGAIVVSGRFR